MIGSDIFSEEKPPPSQQSVSNRVRKPPDVVARIKQLSGSNPVQHEENATLEGFTKMSDKHISEAKVKEMCGTHDFYNGARGDSNKENDENIANDEKKNAGDAEAIAAHYRLIRPLTSDTRRSEKLHSNAKRQEIVGNYDLLSFAPNRHDNADYIKYPSERPASSAKLRELSGSYVFGDDGIC